MKKRTILFLLVLCVALTGCTSWLDGSYSWSEPHKNPGISEEQGITAVNDYMQLRSALGQMVEKGEVTRTFSVAGMPTDVVESNMKMAIHYASYSNPVGAYAVESIEYDLGTSGGVTAVVVTVTYNHNHSQIKTIRDVYGMSAAKDKIYEALNGMNAELVLKINNYEETDYAQLVQDYALERPDMVMEVPQITASVYPASGSVRVLELKFTYQTSRESLKIMQNYVQPKFSSAELFVKTEEDSSMKFARLYAFLMETTEYTVETSITPAYSLLRHGVGDSRAFASVFAAMCTRVGLDCRMISGTRAGEPWFWNLICEDGIYYHVDLLRCYREGVYQKLFDVDMVGYVWDYTAYPACIAPEEPEEDPTDPTEDPEKDPGEDPTDPPENPTNPPPGPTVPPMEPTDPTEETNNVTDGA